MTGEESNQTFSLPQTTTLSDPDPTKFIVLDHVTEADVIAWVEATDTRLDAIKSHIQYVLDQEIAKHDATPTPMPWAPEPVVPPEELVSPPPPTEMPFVDPPPAP